MVEVVHGEGTGKIKVTSSEVFQDEYPLPADWQVMVDNGQWVDIGMVLASPPPAAEDSKQDKAAEKTVALADENQPVIAGVAGQVVIEDGRLSIAYEETEEREYVVPANVHIRVQTGDEIKAGQQLTDGSINPQDLLHILGRDAVQQYLVDEVQRVYRSQGVNINDKHIEIIVHQMLDKVRIETSGDTDLIPGELIDRFQYDDINAGVLAEGGEPTTAQTVLLGITRTSLSTNSWLAAASFQETTKVLTEAAVKGATDKLIGLKENVIIGRLIPARSMVSEEEEAELPAGEEPEELSDLEAALVAAHADETGDMYGLDAIGGMDEIGRVDEAVETGETVEADKTVGADETVNVSEAVGKDEKEDTDETEASA